MGDRSDQTAAPRRRGTSIDGTPFVLVETTSDWDLGFVGPSIDLEDLEIVRLR